MRRDSLTGLAAGLLVVCALILTSIALTREFRHKPPRGSPLDNWSSFATAGHVFGTQGAPAVMVVFSDFDCVYCGRLARRPDSLLNENPGKLAVRFRHFPMISIHPTSEEAAAASDCAGLQGRFREYHDLLFTRSCAQSEADDWTRVASRAGVFDTAAFSMCMRDSTTVAAVQKDIEAGLSLGLSGTPLILSNGHLYRGAQSLRNLREIVRSSLTSRTAVFGRKETNNCVAATVATLLRFRDTVRCAV